MLILNWIKAMFELQNKGIYHCKKCYTLFDPQVWKYSNTPIMKSRIPPLGRSCVRECPNCKSQILIFIPNNC